MLRKFVTVTVLLLSTELTIGQGPSSFSGTWYYEGQTQAPCNVSAAGPILQFQNERGETALGTINDVSGPGATAREVFMQGWGQIRALTLARGQVLLWENGTYWTRLPGVSTANYNFGGPCSLVFDGPSIQAINERGERSAIDLQPGFRLIARDWQGLAGVVQADGTISWANGTAWGPQ